MTNIQIKSITLSYFKGVKHLTINFNDGVTTISGDNGTGKTTLVDAFLWVLFNKNSAGQTKFRIRTTDADGNYITNVENSVELTLSINGVTRSFKKQLVVRADLGSSSKEQSSTAKFFIDGQVCTKGDFDSFIAEIISEDTFRTITSPTHFFSLDWKKQRSLLTSLVEEPTADEINSEHDFDLVEEALKSQLYRSLEDYAKHIKYQSDEIKKQLDLIPTQIEENKRAMPEEQDWNDIQTKLSELEKTIEAEKRHLAELTSNKNSAKIEYLQKQIDFQQKRITTIAESSCRMSLEAIGEHNEILSKVRANYNKNKQDLEDIFLKLKGIQARISQTNLSIKEQKAEQEKIRKEWQEKVNCHFVEPDYSDAVCPTCGQPLPLDQVKELKIQALEAFNLAKAEAKKSLIERANVSKTLLSRAETDLKSYGDELTTLSAQQKALSEYLPKYEAELAELSKNQPKSARELMEVNVGYQDAKRKIEEYKAQMDAPSGDVPTEEIEEGKSKLKSWEDIKSLLQFKLATKDIFLSHSKRISELEEKQVTLRSQLDSLLQQSDQILQYQLRSNAILESRINEHFHYVQFSLFRNLVNGSTEPFCEGLVGNVPISTNVNTAAKLNAGLDVCNVFSDKLGIIAPVFVDNSESINDIIPTKGQQIQLYVSNDPELTIK